MPLALESVLLRGGRGGSAGTVTSTGVFPLMDRALVPGSAHMHAVEGNDGGTEPLTGAVAPVVEGDPDGELERGPLRVLRVGTCDAPAPLGAMLGDPPLCGSARCISDGLEQRMLSTPGRPPVRENTPRAAVLLAAARKTGLFMGASLSQCICQLSRLIGAVRWALPTRPLASTDAETHAAQTAAIVIMERDLLPSVDVAAASTRQSPGASAGLLVPFPRRLPTALPSVHTGGGNACDLVVACQRAVLDGYVVLVHRGVLPCGLNVGGTALRAGHPLCHAIQDPTGALTAALLIVRRNRSSLCTSNPCGLPSGRIGRATRRALCAILCVTHKMTALSGCCSYRVYAEHCVEVMQSRFDVPTDEIGWMREMSAMMQAEKAVLEEPLLALTSENPLGELECILFHLQDSKNLAHQDASIIRGMAFYFVGSLLFQRDVCGVDRFIDGVGMRTVATGCVICSLACFAVAGLKESGPSRLAAAHAASVAKSGGKGVRRAGAVVMAAAVAAESDVLRHGPYGRYPNHYDSGGHPVQLLLHPSNLMRARARAEEAGWLEAANN